MRDHTRSRREERRAFATGRESGRPVRLVAGTLYLAAAARRVSERSECEAAW